MRLPGTISVELIFHGLKRFHVKMNHDWRTADGLRAGARISGHSSDSMIIEFANLQFRVADFSIGRFHAHFFSGAESVFLKLNRTRGVFDEQIRRDAVITIRGGFDFVLHDFQWFARKGKNDFG